MEVHQTFLPTPTTYGASVEDGLLLLNASTGETIGLNATAGLIWHLLADGASVLDVIHVLEERSVIDTHTLHSDVDLFLQALLEKHFLMPRLSTSARLPLTKIPLPRTLRLLSRLNRLLHWAWFEWVEAFFFLRYCDHTLSLQGLETLARTLIALPAFHRVTAQESCVQHFARLVASAARWHTFPAVCLHQSFALCFLLRLRQKKVDLVIGVTTFPFFAHAWVACGTLPVSWTAGLGQDRRRERLDDLSVLFRASETMR